MNSYRPNDFDEQLEQDALWELLDHSSQSHPSPTFVQDTVRIARLEADCSQNTTSWWRTFFSPKLLVGSTVLACGAVALMISLGPSAPSASPQLTTDANPTSQEWTELEDTLASELLAGATEDPSLLSDEEIVALIF